MVFNFFIGVYTMDKNKLRNIGLYFITDSKLTKKNIFKDVDAAVKGGVRIVQYREKTLRKEEMVEEAKKLKEVCRENDVLFLINDFVDIALEVDADGVHLGLDDMSYEKAREVLGEGKIIGLTAHNKEEAAEFEKLGVDYLGVSPVFDTATKLDAGRGMGVERLKEIISSVNIPCIAIGGINEYNAAEVLKTKVDGIAMISAIVTKDDVEEAVIRVSGEVKNIKNKNIFK